MAELIGVIILIAAAAFIWLKMNPPQPVAKVLPFYRTFPCPEDGGYCTDLMCEEGPSKCLMTKAIQKVRENNWQSVFRGSGCE